MRLRRVYDRHKDRADFYWIYIREAHPTDSARPARHAEIRQPQSIEEREQVAQRCTGAIDLGMPVLVDDMKDTAAGAYQAWPDRLFIVDGQGMIAYSGGRGPFGFKVDEMEESLRRLLAPKSQAPEKPAPLDKGG